MMHLKWTIKESTIFRTANLCIADFNLFPYSLGSSFLSFLLGFEFFIFLKLALENRTERRENKA